jgi:hypothetical protein
VPPLRRSHGQDRQLLHLPRLRDEHRLQLALFVHLLYLVGLENRLLVFIRWTISFVTRGRGTRLIVGGEEQPLSAEPAGRGATREGGLRGHGGAQGWVVVQCSGKSIGGGAMTEPREIAEQLEPVVDGVLHWRIHNSNIGGAISSSHAVLGEQGAVLIDPVQLDERALATLPRPQAIVLSAKCHQRSAWRYRAQFGAAVWLPEDARPADEEPDRRYGEGDLLPGDLRALRTPGPEWPHYSLLLEREPAVLFCSDLISNDGGRTLRFVPPEYHDDPEETRRSVEKLLRLDFDVLCLDHGAPIVEDPQGALRQLLESTA